MTTTTRTLRTPTVPRPAPTDDDTPRCRACHHPLTARRSIARELGPVCAHRLAQVIAQATGYRVVVSVLEGGLVARLGEVTR